MVTARPDSLRHAVASFPHKTPLSFLTGRPRFTINVSCMSSELSQYIIDRLERDLDVLRADFTRPRDIPTRFTAIDDLFPADTAAEISNAFPPVDEMRIYKSFREKKYTSRSADRWPKALADAIFAFHDPRVIDLVSHITGGKDVVADPFLYAGGISAMAEGHFLNPHIDNSHDYERKNYRVLNLLYYCSSNWDPENCGNLELWDEKITRAIEVPSLFNRLVLMETNERSWHSVNQVRTNQIRRCVSNYYFSPHSPNGHETQHITFFRARPEQKVRRLVSAADGHLRNALRKVIKSGFSKKDLYSKP